MEKEQWKDIPGYEGLYQVSDQGNVKSLARTVPSKKEGYTTMTLTEKNLIKRPTTKGYWSQVLYKCGQKKFHQIHSLVMLAFVGKRDLGMNTNHINGNKKDNRLVNLEYVSAKENTQHGINVLGRKRHGEFSGKNKYKTEVIIEIKKKILNGERLCDIAKEFNMSAAYICNIRSGRVWKHII